jgi:hypothetical protein
MAFQTTGLAPQSFAHLADLDDDALRERGAVRMRADRPSAFPCRVSLACAEPGEEVVLLNFEHQPVESSPYRAKGPIFVRPSAVEPARFADEFPEGYIRGSYLSLRAYDSRAFIVDAAVAKGEDIRPAVERLLARPDTAYLHAHFAGRGCFAARIDRL